MSTFFRQTAQAMIAKHIDRFPLLKLDQVIDWQPIEHYLNRQKNRYLRDHRGRPAYPLQHHRGNPSGNHQRDVVVDKGRD
ncbi:hypothetical protein NM75643_1925, partial [Neisseria meningitidis 75643]